MKFINETLLDPGRKFIVTDQIKAEGVGAGTCGWISTINCGHENWQNVAKVSCILTRKGKTGKPRIERMELLVPVFYHYDNSENFAKIMPDPSNARWYVLIEPDGAPEENIMNVQTIDFIGWATAMTWNIRNLQGKTRYGGWPEDQAHPLNRFQRMNEMFNEEPQRFLDQYENPPERLNVVNAIRSMESIVFKIKMAQTMKKLDIVLNSAEFLIYVNKGEFISKDAEDKNNEFKFANNDELLEQNLEFHKKRKADLEALCKDKKIPNISSF
jgi:hypothetical protein